MIERLFEALRCRHLLDRMPDPLFLKFAFRARMGRKLHLKDPRTFNEKLQWLKLHNRKPEYTMMVDKYLVRDYIRQTLGEEYLIPLLGVWDRPEDIDFEALPDRFVLKCNHNSGLGMCICKDKSRLDYEAVKAGLAKGLAQNYYLNGREWPYKDVPRKIICEQYMEDASGELTDYKFFCFDGGVDSVMVCIERSTGNPRFYFFDREWNLLRYNNRGITVPEDFTLPKPDNLDEMFDIAARISQGMPYVRVDLYSCNGRTYFGEFTFFPDNGFDDDFYPEVDLALGQKLRLN